MKCKIIFDTKTKPTYENFEKAELFEECKPIWDILKFACRNRNGKFIEGYLYCLELESVYTFYYARSLDSISYIPTYQLLNKLVKPSPLTFNTLRKANIARIPEFKNSKGEPAHSKPDGSDWSPADWLGAVLGELGEYANIMKKVKRGDFTFEEAKPLIEKELADAQIYLDILAFRVGVDLAKATENKFNEVSERIGCNLRIENNEVVRKETETYAKKYPIYYTTSPQPQPIDFAKLGSGELTSFSINDRKSYVSPTKKELHSGTITNIKVQTTNSVINENVTLSISENDEIKISVNSFRQELFVRKSFSSDIGGALNEMVRWKLFRNYAEIYPLKISRSTIEDIFSFEFQGIDNNKQYLFYHAKRVFHAYRNMSLIQRYVQQSYLFEYFSKQLGTKIIGMLINGSKENTKLNPGDLIQFHDDRNVLYNFRLVKSSDKNVEVSAT